MRFRNQCESASMNVSFSRTEGQNAKKSARQILARFAIATALSGHLKKGKFMYSKELGLLLDGICEGISRGTLNLLHKATGPSTNIPSGRVVIEFWSFCPTSSPLSPHHHWRIHRFAVTRWHADRCSCFPIQGQWCPHPQSCQHPRCATRQPSSTPVVSK